MSEDRPETPPERQDEARLLHAGARERLLVAAADLAVPERLRLTDWQRTTVASLIARLVRTVEDELRAALLEEGSVRAHQALAAALASAHVAIAAPILERSSALPDRSLVSTLVRRAAEHRRSRGSAPGQWAQLVQLVQDEDASVAEHAMATLIAQSRRYETFTEPAAFRTELSAELEHRLVWRVAAALRHYLVSTQGLDSVKADEAVVAAAERLLATYDEGDALEARAMRLARRLDATGRLSDELILAALSEGSLPLFLAGLAVRVSISQASVWEILSDPRGRGAPFLLRAAGVGRDHSASILLLLAETEEIVPGQVDLYEVTDVPAARNAIRLWRYDASYREAIADLAG